MTLKDWVMFGGAAAVAVVAAAVVVPLLPAWWQARRAARLGQVLSMRMRMPRREVVSVLVAAMHAERDGVEVSVSDLETHTLAGGDVLACVGAMAEARRRRVRAEWDAVRASDLAGIDVVAVVRAGIDPADGVLGGKKYEGRFRKT